MARKPILGFTKEAQRLLGASPVMRALREETAEVDPPIPDEQREAAPTTPERAEADEVQQQVVAAKKGGRRRHPVRDELVVEVCKHLQDRSDWSKLLQKEFAAKLYKQFNEAVSEDQIKEIIRVAGLSFPRP